MKKNFFAMDNESLVAFVANELKEYKANIRQADTEKPVALGTEKVKLSELQQYSKLLQLPAAMDAEGKAAQVKNEIDTLLGEFSHQPMVRDVKKLDMSAYYQKTNQFTPGYHK